MNAFKLLCLTLVILFLTLVSYEGEHLNCINSTYVVSIDIGLSEHLYSCLEHKYEPMRISSKLVKGLISDVSSLDRFLKSTLQAQVDPMTLQFDENSSLWRESLLYQFLIHLNSNRSRIETAILTDILSYVIYGNSKMESFSCDGLILLSEREACIKGVVPSHTSQYCVDVERIAYGGSAEDVSEWSFRPMIFAQFLKVYKRMGFLQKRQYVQNILLLWKDTPVMTSYALNGKQSFSSLYLHQCQRLLGSCDPLQRVSTLVRWVDFHPPYASAFVSRKIRENHLGIMEIQGYYNTQFGAVKISPQIDFKVDREVWIYHRDIKLKDLFRVKQSYVDLLSIQDAKTMRLQVATLAVLYKMGIINPNSSLAELQDEKVKSWLRYSPLEKL